MMRVLAVRLLDAIARALRTLADSVEHRAAMIYRAHIRAEITKAEANEVRAKVERAIAESRTPSYRVGSPLHRDR